MFWRYTITLLAGVMLSTATTLASRQHRIVITAEEVTGALLERGITVAPSQVSFFSDVLSSQQSPTLELLSLKSNGNLRSVAKIRCANNRTCIPFYVALKWNRPEQQESAQQSWITQSHTQTTKTNIAPILVRAGDAATLVIEGEQLQMKLQVVCLENGKAGNRIRVRSRDGKQIYRAEVVASKFLRGAI